MHNTQFIDQTARTHRNRESLVKARTDQKNRVRRVLDSACIKLSSVLSNLFGKAGMVVIKGLLNGEDIDKILEKNPSKILKRKEMDLREAIKSELSPMQIFVIGQCLEIIDEYDRQIMELDAPLVDKMKEKMEDLKILMSVPRTLRKFVSEHFLWGFGICLRSRRCLIPGDAISVEHVGKLKRMK